MMQRALRSPTSSAAAGAVILAAAAAWFLVLGQTSGMASAPGTMGFGFAGFVALWTVMMAAMMLPAVSPVAGLYARSLSARSRGTALAARTSALVAGYLAAWAAVGVVAFAAALAGGRLARSHPDAAVWVGAGILAAAGIYQLSPPKERCLVHCRAPFALLFRMSEGRGPLRDLRAGLWHGAYCIGCCFALMAALIALGIMSIGWMVLLSGVVVTERGWRHGRWVTRAVAVGLIALAVIAPLHPGLVPGLHEPAAPMGM
jgi:predicted metal-binding membrane protein